VIHLPLLKWIGLGKFNGLVFREAGGIMTILLALETSDVREVLLGFSVVAMLTIMSIVMSTGAVSLETSTMLMDIEVTTVSFVETTPMLVQAAMSTALRWVVLLMEWFHMALAVTKFPFTVLFFLDVVIQHDSLIKQRLIVWSIGHKQGYFEFSLEPTEEFFLPLCISINIFRCIPGQSIEVIHVLLQSSSTLSQTAEFILLHSHSA
jgi:hypothetical protein